MNILTENWGGKYQCQEISAKKGLNVDKLLEKVLMAIGVDQETASEEACRIEHDINDDTYDKINAFYQKHFGSSN